MNPLELLHRMASADGEVLRSTQELGECMKLVLKLED